MVEYIAEILKERKGHFIFESGHHGDRWLDLDLLFYQPAKITPVVIELSNQIRQFEPEIVCGPLEEGAFLALLVAISLNIPFTYSLRTDLPAGVKYTVPTSQAVKLHGKRVAVIDDVVNAGSALNATVSVLYECGALPVVLAAMAEYRSVVEELALRNNIGFVALLKRSSQIWEPDCCPLCSENIPFG